MSQQQHTNSPNTELQIRLRKGYLERLQLRSLKMRQLLTQRKWESLRLEVLHIVQTSAGFQLQSLFLIAKNTADTWPDGLSSSATVDDQTVKNVESIIASIDNQVATEL